VPEKRILLSHADQDKSLPDLVRKPLLLAGVDELADLLIEPRYASPLRRGCTPHLQRALRNKDPARCATWSPGCGSSIAFACSRPQAAPQRHQVDRRHSALLCQRGWEALDRQSVGPPAGVSGEESQNSVRFVKSRRLRNRGELCVAGSERPGISSPSSDATGPAVGCAARASTRRDPVPATALSGVSYASCTAARRVIAGMLLAVSRDARSATREVMILS
jgi:hypothetical protein